MLRNRCGYDKSIDRYQAVVFFAQTVLALFGDSHFRRTSPVELSPRSALGKAMNYADKQWPKLIVYPEDGTLRIYNYLVENAIRPFVIGHKNVLFCDTVIGANVSANVYSSTEKAKANRIEPYANVRIGFTELPNATTVEAVEGLLPGPD